MLIASGVPTSIRFLSRRANDVTPLLDHPPKPPVYLLLVRIKDKRTDRGLLGGLKDEAIRTKEEREAEKRRQEEVIRYATDQLRFDSDPLHRIAVV